MPHRPREPIRPGISEKIRLFGNPTALAGWLVQLHDRGSGSFPSLKRDRFRQYPGSQPDKEEARTPLRQEAMSGCAR